MTTLLYAALVLVLGGTLLWSGFRGHPGVAAALFGLIAVAAPITYFDGAGMPKPASLEWRPLAEAKVVAVSLDEPKAIYLWLIADGDTQPRAYILPWQSRTAEQAQQAMQQAQKSGRGVRMRHAPGTEPSGEDEAVFYPEPQAPLPPKTR